MSDAIRAGVIGFGLGGRIFHTAIIHAVPGLELAAIVQRHGNSAAEAYPQAKTVRSMEELLEDTSIRLVAVTTPNATHYALARQALEADRDVVVDKPFTLKAEEAKDLIQLAHKKKRLLAVYQNRRWDGDFLTIKELLEKKTLGRLVSFESHFDRWRPELRPLPWKESPETGGGTLLDLGPHLIDQSLTLFGLPEAVLADVRAERNNSAVDDAFDLKLFYPNLTVWLRSSCMTCIPGPRYSLHGTQGSYVKFGLDPQEDALKAGGQFSDPHWGEEPESQWGTLSVGTEASVSTQRLPTKAGDYRNYYANVRDALLGRAPLAVTAEQGWNTMRVLELARLSSERREAFPFPLTEEI